MAVAPERRDAVDALEPLYREQGRWPDVVDNCYERRASALRDDDRGGGRRCASSSARIHWSASCDRRGGRDRTTTWAAPGRAIPRHAALAARRASSATSPRSLTCAGSPPRCREPISTSASNRWLDLIRLSLRRPELAGASVRDAQRLKLTRFVARLYEEQLEDFEHASHWYARVFREQPADPAIRDQLNRLASIVDNWGFVAQTYQGYLDDEAGESPELREVAIAAATIYDRRLGDVQRAYDAYRRALSIDADGSVPDERELVRRLEELLGRAQRWAELIAVYDDVIGRTDDELRRDALIKRARLYEDGLADGARAVDAWREVVLATEMGGSPKVEFAYREAVGELERLYRAPAVARPRRAARGAGSAARPPERDRRAPAPARRPVREPAVRPRRGDRSARARRHRARRRRPRGRRARAARRPRAAPRARRRPARASLPRAGLVAEARRHPRREAPVHPRPDPPGPYPARDRRDPMSRRGGAL